MVQAAQSPEMNVDDLETGGPQGQHTPTSTSTTSSAKERTADSNEDIETPNEAAARRLSSTRSQPPLSRHVTSNGTMDAPDPAFEVDWDGPNDKSNPKNWSIWYRGVVIFIMSFATWVV